MLLLFGCEPNTRSSAVDYGLIAAGTGEDEEDSREQLKILELLYNFWFIEAGKVPLIRVSAAIAPALAILPPASNGRARAGLVLLS